MTKKEKKKTEMIKRLRIIRKNTEISQEAMAILIGVATKTYFRWEKEITLPSDMAEEKIKIILDRFPQL